jgi:hypothetical protein
MIDSLQSRRAATRRDLLMSSRKLDEVSTDLNDASIVVEELQDDPETDAPEKLEELHKTLEDASDTMDEIQDKDE